MTTKTYTKEQLAKLLHRRRRALEELMTASFNLATDSELVDWAIKGEPTGRVWAKTQMLREAIKEYDKYA